MALKNAKILPTLDVMIFCSLISHSLNAEASVVECLSKLPDSKSSDQALNIPSSGFEEQLTTSNTLQIKIQVECVFDGRHPTVTDKDSFNKYEAGTARTL